MTMRLYILWCFFFSTGLLGGVILVHCLFFIANWQWMRLSNSLDLANTLQCTLPCCWYYRSRSPIQIWPSCCFFVPSASLRSERKSSKRVRFESDYRSRWPQQSFQLTYSQSKPQIMPAMCKALTLMYKYFSSPLAHEIVLLFRIQYDVTQCLCTNIFHQTQHMSCTRPPTQLEYKCKILYEIIFLEPILIIAQHIVAWQCHMVS